MALISREFQRILHSRLKLLQLSFIFVLLSLLLETKASFASLFLTFLIKIPLTSLLYYLAQKALKNLLYSFWSFFLFLLFWELARLFIFDLNLGGIILNSASLITLGILGILLFSPLFYPQIRWWEYDFRFISDFPIKLSHEEKQYEGRILDIKREVVVIWLFEAHPLNEAFQLSFQYYGKEDELEGIVKMVRPHPYGRGYYVTLLLSVSGDFFETPEELKKKILHLNRLVEDYRSEKKFMKFKETPLDER